METVEILVRIPKRDFEELQSNYVWWGKHGEYIKNGTVLPKGHGRLISTNDLDITKLVDSDIEWVMGRCDISRVQDMIDNAPTVIEADKDKEGSK